MKKKHIIIGIILSATIIGLMFYRLTLFKNGNSSWLSILILLLTGLYIKEIIISWKNKKILWDYLNYRDKLIIITSMIIQLSFFLYPIKEELNVFLILLLSGIGLVISFILLYTIGSEELRKRYLLIK